MQWMYPSLWLDGPGTSEKAQVMCRHMQAVNAANAPILPIMLSTMALPEMEAEEKSLLADQAASMDAMSDADLHAALAVRWPLPSLPPWAEVLPQAQPLNRQCRPAAS